MKSIKLLIASAMIAGCFTAMPLSAETVKSQDPVLPKPAATQQVAPVGAMVNINSADATVLADRLNGIGLKKAQAIVDYRQQNGPFKSVDELANVSGVGQATVEKNRSIISVN